MSNECWFLKHKPKKFIDLHFSTDVHLKTLKWLKNYKKGNFLHLKGPVGSGKTSLAILSGKLLKYFPVVIQENISFTKFTQNKSFNNKKILLILKNIKFNNSLLNSSVPIIFISSDSYYKNIETFTVEKPNYENIINIINNILKKENNKNINERDIIKISEDCNYDLRSIINIIQIKHYTDLTLNFNKNFYDNLIFKNCKLILNKIMRLNVLEKYYSEKLVDLTISSLLENNKNIEDIKKILIKRSLLDKYPKEYKYLILKSINRSNTDFIYKKEKPYFECNKKTPECLLFLSHYKRNIYNQRSSTHLKNIFKKFKVKIENKIDEDILNMKYTEKIKNKIFKYKFHLNTSSLVYRDITTEDLLNL